MLRRRADLTYQEQVTTRPLVCHSPQLSRWMPTSHELLQSCNDIPSVSLSAAPCGDTFTPSRLHHTHLCTEQQDGVPSLEEGLMRLFPVGDFTLFLAKSFTNGSEKQGPSSIHKLARTPYVIAEVKSTLSCPSAEEECLPALSGTARTTAALLINHQFCS